MSDQLIGLLVQIPLVAAFMWFTLKLEENHNKAIAEIIAAHNLVMSKRDEEWREFLTAEREARIEWKTNVALEMNELTSAIKDTHAAIVEHDRFEREEVWKHIPKINP